MKRDARGWSNSSVWAVVKPFSAATLVVGIGVVLRLITYI